MNLLLDTHVFIWWSISPKGLSSQAENLIANTDNALFLSLVSVWEMQIKIQLGKLDLDIAQSIVENINLVSIDRVFDLYSVNRIW